MIVDDVDDFLKFLDNVSLQLACLLDIDRLDSRNVQQIGVSGKKSRTRQTALRIPLSSSTTTTPVTKSSKQTKSKAKYNNNHLTSSGQVVVRSSNQPTRVRGRRKQTKLLDGLLDSTSNCNDHLQQLQKSTSEDPSGNNNNNNHHLQHIESHLEDSSQANKLQQSILSGAADSQAIDTQLTLSIGDELPMPLDQVGVSISPSSHLSPMEPSIHSFANSLHQQHHYYTTTGPSPLNHQRANGHHHHHHLDSYQLHDDFISHDQIPISNPSPTSEQQGRIVDQHHQHLINHQVDTSTATTADCYQRQQLIQQHQHQQQHHHHHHQQQHHHLQQPQHHDHLQNGQSQYHQLDQQSGWLSNTSAHSTEVSLHLSGAADSSLDQVVIPTPLDQVQFNAPIYHHNHHLHHSYYNHHSDQLDSFQHLNDVDAFAATSSSSNHHHQHLNSTSSPSSSSNQSHLHLSNLRQDQTQQQQQQSSNAQVSNDGHQQHQQQTSQLALPSESSSSLCGSDNVHQNNNDEDFNQHHNQQQQHLQQAHNHHSQQLNTHQDYLNNGLNQHHQHHPLSLHDHHNHHHSNHLHHNHHNHHQQSILPLLEPHGVIIQDINLASATWSSPEDLYSI